MEFSRAVLAASVSVLGLLLYVVAILFAVLAAANHWRGDGAPATTTLTLATASAAAGFACRVISRRIV